jgi:hypothetical protein
MQSADPLLDRVTGIEVALSAWERAHDLFLIREACTASDVPRQVVQLPLPSVNVHRRPLAVAAVVTQLVTHEATLYWAMITHMTRRLARYR